MIKSWQLYFIYIPFFPFSPSSLDYLQNSRYHIISSKISEIRTPYLKTIMKFKQMNNFLITTYIKLESHFLYNLLILLSTRSLFESEYNGNWYIVFFSLCFLTRSPFFFLLKIIFQRNLLPCSVSYLIYFAGYIPMALSYMLLSCPLYFLWTGSLIVGTGASIGFYYFWREYFIVAYYFRY